MPRRRFRKKRIFGRRRGRKIVRRYRRKMSKLGRHFYKLKYTTAVTAAAGVLSLKFTMRYPDSALELSAFNALFDSYRVCALKLKFYPSVPNDTSTTTAYSPLYAVVDQDADSSGANFLTSVNQALQYERVRAINMYKPWKLYVKIPKVYSGFTNSGTPRTRCTVLKDGFIDINTPMYTGTVGFYGTGFTGTTNYGNLVVTYYTAYENRR